MDRFSKYKLYEADVAKPAPALKFLNKVKTNVETIKGVKSPSGSTTVDQSVSGEISLVKNVNFTIIDKVDEKYNIDFAAIYSLKGESVPFYTIITENENINNKQNFFFVKDENYEDIKKTFEILKNFKAQITNQSTSAKPTTFSPKIPEKYIPSFNDFLLENEAAPVAGNQQQQNPNPNPNPNPPKQTMITPQKFDSTLMYNFGSYSKQLGENYQIVKNCLDYLTNNRKDIFNGSYANFAKFETITKPESERKKLCLWYFKKYEKNKNNMWDFSLTNGGDTLKVGDKIKVCKNGEKDSSIIIDIKSIQKKEQNKF